MAERYRKKPVEIEALRFTQASCTEAMGWCGGTLGLTALGAANSLTIHTLEGDMVAKVGDWIIRGVKGEFYPCKPDIFEATYEPADG